MAKTKEAKQIDWVSALHVGSRILTGSKGHIITVKKIWVDGIDSKSPTTKIEYTWETVYGKNQGTEISHLSKFIEIVNQ